MEDTTVSKSWASGRRTNYHGDLDSTTLKARATVGGGSIARGGRANALRARARTQK